MKHNLKAVSEMLVVFGASAKPGLIEVKTDVEGYIRAVSHLEFSPTQLETHDYRF